MMMGLSPDAGNNPFNHHMQRNDIIYDVLLCSAVSCLLHTNYHSYLSANASFLYYYHYYYHYQVKLVLNKCVYSVIRRKTINRKRQKI